MYDPAISAWRDDKGASSVYNGNNTKVTPRKKGSINEVESVVFSSHYNAKFDKNYYGNRKYLN